jgi:hypothetical protein
MPLHLSKVAVGCASVGALERRQQRGMTDGVVHVRTRFRPKRAEELIGGSLFWIIKHRIVARQTILGFAEDGGTRKIIIQLDPRLRVVAAYPRRAHQGWRYLAETDAPPDLGEDVDCGDALPPALLSELSALALI